MNHLVADKVTKRYANHLALNSVSIQVPPQTIFGLLGPNGAGKTSLIRIINQITAPDEGQILLNGRPLQAADTARIGYLPEERGLYKKMKVGDQALYLAQLKGVDKHTAKKKLQEWFEKFEIQGWWNRKVEELSKGMQQKIQFIVTVIHEPELLIFDEPFSGFDPINVNLLKTEILRLKENGATILFSTHNMASVEELCDHIALINASEKILEGPVDEIRKRYRSHKYELIMTDFKQDLNEVIPRGYHLLTEKKSFSGEYHFVLQSPANVSPNQLITHLLQFGTIQYFSEILPSMNDIFIEQVQSRNIKQTLAMN
jgi:ABC-2 type transport system ATP-binding protein